MTATDTTLAVPHPTRPYLLRFVIAYALALLVIVIIAQAIPLSAGGSVGVVALMAAAVFAMGKFVEAARRGPSARERNALLWGSWALAMGLQLALGLLLLGGEMTLAPLLFGSLIVGILYWIGLRVV